MKNIIACVIGLSLSTSMAWGQITQYPGYAQAVRQAELASTESGVIVEILVREGEAVVAGQPLVRLDYDTHRANLAAAEHEALNTGEIRSAQVRIGLLEQAVAKLRQLVASGNARPLELEREETELEMARATLELRQHDYMARQHQVERSRILLEKRTIQAPFSGRVAKIHHQVGEFVSLQNPQVVTLVDPTELKAEFAVPLLESHKFQPGHRVQLRTEERIVTATVHYLGLLVDRSSQTITVQVRFSNDSSSIRPGTDCVLLAPTTGLFGQTASLSNSP